MAEKKIVLIDTGERRFPVPGELFVYLGSDSRPPCLCDGGELLTPTTERDYAILRQESNDFRKREVPGPKTFIVDSLAGIRIVVWGTYVEREKYNFTRDWWQFDGKWEYPLVSLAFDNATCNMNVHDKRLARMAVENAGGFRR